MTTNVDFLSAMTVGIHAHDSAESNRHEVDAILDRLGAALTNFLGSPTQVVRTQVHRPINPMVDLLTSTPRPKYEALSLHHGAENLQLCEWEESALIFPVTLRFSKSVETAHDAESLERALASLLATPKVGGILKRLKDTAAPKQP